MTTLILAILTLMTNPERSKVEEVTESHKFVSIKEGATFKEVLMAYGKPNNAERFQNIYKHNSYIQLFYWNDLCSYSSCYVIIEDGKMISSHGIKPQYAGVF